jgi:hypothetical protein
VIVGNRWDRAEQVRHSDGSVSERAEARGSGTSIACEGGQALVVTAGHIFERPGRPYVVYPSGKTYTGTLVARSVPAIDAAGQVLDDTPDLALVALDCGESVAATAVADEDPREGAIVYKVGYPAWNQGRQDMGSGTVLSARGQFLAGKTWAAAPCSAPAASSWRASRSGPATREAASSMSTAGSSPSPRPTPPAIRRSAWARRAATSASSCASTGPARASGGRRYLRRPRRPRRPLPRRWKRGLDPPGRVASLVRPDRPARTPTPPRSWLASMN